MPTGSSTSPRRTSRRAASRGSRSPRPTSFRRTRSRRWSQAEEFAEKDRERAEVIQARNAAESLAYEAERVLTDAKDKIGPDEATAIREKAKALRELVEKKDASAQEIRTGTEELTKALHAVAQKLYQSAGPGGSGGPAEAPPTAGASETPPPGGTGPVDADYKVVDSGDNNGEKGTP